MTSKSTIRLILHEQNGGTGGGMSGTGRYVVAVHSRVKMSGPGAMGNFSG